MRWIDLAKDWVRQDPDPETRRELQTLIDAEDFDAIRERFSSSLEFGTAGLRALLGAGPARMNRVTVMKTTAALCAWLKRQVPRASERGICLGGDARVKSDVFVRDAAEVIAGAGIRVMRFSDVVPTPVLGFAVLQTGASAGVMITASHNPPAYNGYKVYWENGPQIIPPHDAGIASEIARAPTADAIPRESVSAESLDHLVDRYVECISGEVQQRRRQPNLRIAYTALHGVGESVLRSVFDRAGFPDLQSVPTQAVPDGRFPTVRFPNPEVSEAMDRVLALAAEIDADLALANDPDADRLAVVARHAGGLIPLTGNDVGVLLAEDLLSRYRGGPRPFVLSTIVSSPMMASIAQAHGAHWEPTLTGHKWIQNRALELERQGLRYVFGYEEALGYAPTTWVRDKDGISSAVMIADLARRLKAEGKTLVDARNELWRKYGVVDGRGRSLVFDASEGKSEASARMERYRQKPPTTVAGLAVTAVTDLKNQTKLSNGQVSALPSLPPSDTLIFEMEGGHQTMVRPSGTEPKLKYYFYVRVPVAPGESLDPARAHAGRLLDRIENAFLGPTTDC